MILSKNKQTSPKAERRLIMEVDSEAHWRDTILGLCHDWHAGMRPEWGQDDFINQLVDLAACHGVLDWLENHYWKPEEARNIMFQNLRRKMIPAMIDFSGTSPQFAEMGANIFFSNLQGMRHIKEIRK